MKRNRLTGKKTSSTKYWLYGRHSVINMLLNSRRKYDKILCTKETLLHIKELLEQHIELNYDKIHVVEPHLIASAISNKNPINSNNFLHQGIAAYVYKLEQYDMHDIITDTSKQTIVLLDQLQDSQNIGAIIRSAGVFNVKAVVSTLHASPDENAQMVKAACGAFEYVSFLNVVNLSQTMELLKKHGYWIIGMDANGDKSLYDVQKSFSQGEKIALVVGNEESGMRHMITKNCDFIFNIPINTHNGVDSLNVSNATAIALYEINRLQTPCS